MNSFKAQWLSKLDFQIFTCIVIHSESRIMYCDSYIHTYMKSTIFLFHKVRSYAFICLSQCFQLYVVCVSKLHLHQPTFCLVDHTVVSCLLATCLAPAAQCYLFARALWFLPVGMRWLSCGLCEFKSPPPPILLLPFVVTCRDHPDEKHWFRFLFTPLPIVIAVKQWWLEIVESQQMNME